MRIWKRNAVVGAIVVFVCVAVYLNWSMGQQVSTTDSNSGTKLLGGSAVVTGDTSSETLTNGDVSVSDGSTSVSDSTVADTTTGTTSSSVGYFAEARLNRQQARDSAIALLQEAASDENATQTIKDDANQSIQTMASYTVSEAEVENLITAKGFSDCVCFLSSDSVSVVVAAPDGGLTEADTAKIMEIVKEETNMTASQIKIIEATP